MTATFDTLPAIPIFVEAHSLLSGVPSFIRWDTNSSTQHHWLIGGNSGSGKSYHLMLTLAKLCKYMPTSTRLYLLDFKSADELLYLKDIPNARYYTHDRCADGLRAFNEEIEGRLQGNSDRSPLFAVFDEYASFISYTSVLDKKLAAQCQMWMMNALFMSRSVGGYCTICTQRPDQSIMPSGGARDQFGVRVWWGRFSSVDAQQMMFGDWHKQIPGSYEGGVGRGIAYLDGKGLFQVASPRIRYMDEVKDAIRILVTR